MRYLLSNLLNIGIILFLVTFVYSIFSGNFNYVAYVLMAIILVSVMSLFSLKGQNKNIYFLVGLATVFLLLTSFLNQQYVKNNLNKIDNTNILESKTGAESNLIGKENTKEASTESLIQDIQIDIKNNIDKEIVKEKILYAIQKAEERKDKNISSSYLDLGHIYEIAFVSGSTEAISKALESYNQYCLLEPNDANCYATIARFLIIDKSRKKEAIIFAKKALELSKDTQETENYNKLLNYIEKL